MDFLKGRIEVISMEVQEHKKLMNEITKYRAENDPVSLWSALN